jgi:integrase
MQARQITITPAQSNITQFPTPDHHTLDWLTYWNPAQAWGDVMNHIEALPGSRHERHTMRAYLSALADFVEYAGASTTRHDAEDYEVNWQSMTMPTRALITSYIAHSMRRGLGAKTITRYLASVRLFMRKLEEQQVIPRSGADFVVIMEGQRQLRLSATTPNPKPDTTSNRPALDQHGKRLNLHEVNLLFGSFTPGATSLPDITTLTGKRDLALLYLGITSGLRAAELARITPAAIREGTHCHEVHIRGKRANTDPVGIDATAHALITQWIEAYNAALPLGDERRIDNDTPIWQPLLRGDAIPPLGLRGNRAETGISARAILGIVARRTEEALGYKITAHDMRRTCAYLMRSHGYEWDTIRSQLRHKSIGTTEKYVGREQDLSKALLSKQIDFQIPHDDRLI